MQLKSQIFSWRFRRGLSVAITILSFSPPEVPSIAPQPQALQLDIPPVIDCSQKILSRVIHVMFSLPKIGGVVCEISSKKHEGPSSLNLKAPHIYIRDTEDILVSAVVLIIYASLLYYGIRHGG